MNLLTKFWNGNFARRFASDASNMPDEVWGPGNTYANHWSSPTKMIGVHSSSARKLIWDETRDMLGEWTGMDGAELSPTSLYGVRVYTEGAVLAPHVDRNPLVLSAIINVAQDVDEPWPLEVYGRDGKAVNVTMEPGDVVLYESHSIIHGRPFPLRGRHYANVFVHFEPLGHTMEHDARNGGAGGDDDEESLADLYRAAWTRLRTKCADDEGGCRSREDLNVVRKTPHYILPGSDAEMRWLQSHGKSKLVIVSCC